MSWVLAVSLLLLVIAVVLIERRAVRTGDERQHTAPGFVFITCGVFLLAVGVAAAIAGHEPIALLTSTAGLAAVALGSTRHREVVAH